MPELALKLCGAWVLLLVVARALMQWRRTGSTGIKGLRGRLGSLEWFAEITATLGLILLPIAAIVALRQWSSAELFFQSKSIHVFGALLVVAGIVGALAAQLTMGDSWRVGVDTSERTALVTNGIYQWVRNPIFSFIGISIVGFVLLIPNLWSLLAMALVFVGVQLQVRFVEEPYLSALHGQEYQRYTAGVGRFIPGLGKSRCENHIGNPTEEDA